MPSPWVSRSPSDTCAEVQAPVQALGRAPHRAHAAAPRGSASRALGLHPQPDPAAARKPHGPDALRAGTRRDFDRGILRSWTELAELAALARPHYRRTGSTETPLARGWQSLMTSAALTRARATLRAARCSRVGRTAGMRWWSRGDSPAASVVMTVTVETLRPSSSAVCSGPEMPKGRCRRQGEGTDATWPSPRVTTRTSRRRRRRCVGRGAAFERGIAGRMSRCICRF